METNTQVALACFMFQESPALGFCLLFDKHIFLLICLLIFQSVLCMLLHPMTVVPHRIVAGALCQTRKESIPKNESGFHGVAGSQGLTQSLRDL